MTDSSSVPIPDIVHNNAAFSSPFAIDGQVVSHCRDGTCWIPVSTNIDEWLEIDLQKSHLVKTVDFEYRHDYIDETRFKDIEVKSFHVSLVINFKFFNPSYIYTY